MDATTAITAGKAGVIATKAMTTICTQLGIKTIAQSMDEALEEDAWEFVNDASTLVHQVKNSWNDVPEEERPTPGEVGAVLLEAVRASRQTTNRHKRAFLRNAIVNSFNHQLYEEGLTRRLMRILAEVEYGDIRLLSELPNSAGEPQSLAKLGPQGGDKRHHLSILVEHGLALVIGRGRDPGSAEDEGGIAKVTYLGEKMLRFVEDPEKQ